jgi:nucleoside-diphosphate-sugar epimerase
VAAQAGYAVSVVSAVNNEVERRRHETLVKVGVRVTVASLDEVAALESCVRDQQAIIHLAAAQHEAEAPESHFYNVNVSGTSRLLELAVGAGVRRFVHGSTIGVYGQAAEGLVLDETSALAPDNPYGRTKAQAESVVRGFADRIETCIVRIPETYGAGDMRLLKLFRSIARRRYVTLGPGSNEHQLIYVDDLARGLLDATRISAAVGETFVLAGAERVTTNAMVEAIAAAVNRPGRLPHAPLWPFQLAAAVMETTLSPLGIRPPLHRRRLDFFRKSFRFSTEKAEKMLGFRAPTTFVEGADKTARWYRENGLL